MIICKPPLITPERAQAQSFCNLFYSEDRNNRKTVYPEGAAWQLGVLIWGELLSWGINNDRLRDKDGRDDGVWCA